MNKMTERLPIPGHDGYTCSIDGHIFGKSGRQLNERKHSQNEPYLRVDLTDNGKSGTYLVGRLVLLTFDPRPDSDRLAVHYKNSNPVDNRLENLEWVTKSEQCRRAALAKIVPNKWLKERIQAYRDGDQGACYEIIEKFTKLITLYARRLKSEDAYQDITVNLLEVLMAVDLQRFDDESNALQRYLAICIRHKYVYIAIKKQREDSTRKNLPVDDCLHSNTLIPFTADRLFLQEAFDRVTPQQRRVLILHYVYGYTIAEIGKILGVSRQTANGLRQRAIHDLRMAYKK